MGAMRGKAMTDDNQFQELYLSWLKHFAGEWASKLEGVKQITLHDSTKKYEYLIIFWLDGDMPDTDPPSDIYHYHLSLFFKDDDSPRMEVMRDIIFKNFIDSETIYKAYKNGIPPIDFNKKAHYEPNEIPPDYMIEWEAFPLYDGENIPDNLGVGPHSMLLYRSIDQQALMEINPTEPVTTQKSTEPAAPTESEEMTEDDVVSEAEAKGIAEKAADFIKNRCADKDLKCNVNVCAKKLKKEPKEIMDSIIADEMPYPPFTHAIVARAFGLDEDLGKNQIPTLKKRGRDLRTRGKKYREMLKKISGLENVTGDKVG